MKGLSQNLQEHMLSIQVAHRLKAIDDRNHLIPFIRGNVREIPTYIGGNPTKVSRGYNRYFLEKGVWTGDIYSEIYEQSVFPYPHSDV